MNSEQLTVLKNGFKKGPGRGSRCIWRPTWESGSWKVYQKAEWGWFCEERRTLRSDSASAAAHERWPAPAASAGRAATRPKTRRSPAAANRLRRSGPQIGGPSYGLFHCRLRRRCCWRHCRLKPPSQSRRRRRAVCGSPPPPQCAEWRRPPWLPPPPQPPPPPLMRLVMIGGLFFFFKKNFRKLKKNWRKLKKNWGIFKEKFRRI